MLVRAHTVCYECIAYVFNSQLMVEFVNNVPGDRLQRQKMKFIDDLVHSPLFKDQGMFDLFYNFSKILKFLV